MKKSLLRYLTLLLMLISGFSLSWATETPWSNSLWTDAWNMGANTWNGKSWTIASNNSSLYKDRNSTTYLIFGSSGQSFTSLTFSSSAFVGQIKSVSFKIASNGISGSASVTVGGTAYKCGDATSVTIPSTSTAQEFTFTGSGSGEIVITFTNSASTKKQLHFYSLGVTYDPDATGATAPAAPTFTPEGGSYENSVSVVINNPNESGTIFYTTDGTEPTSLHCNGSRAKTETDPVVITTTTTLKARVVNGSFSSDITEATYIITTGSGSGGEGGSTGSGLTDTLTKDNFVESSGSGYKEVSYTSLTTGVKYSGKTNAGQQYMQINTTKGWIYANSQDNKVAKSITFTPNSGSQDETVLVFGSNTELTEAPTAQHTGLVQIVSTKGKTSGTFDLKDSDNNYYKYILVYANKWVRYDAVAFTWDLPDTPEPPTPPTPTAPEAPTFKVNGVDVSGSYPFSDASVSVTLSGAEGLQIWYVEGESANYTDAEELLYGDGQVYSDPITVTASTKIQAVVYDEDNELFSPIATLVLTKEETPVGVTLTEPTFSVTTGSVDGDNKFEGSITVAINNSNGKGTVRYTTDGTEPTASSAEYSAPIEISATTTLKAYVAATAPDTDSPVATVTYTKQETVTPPVGGSGVYKLVKNVSELTENANVIIVGANGSDYYAMSTTQNAKNRGAVSVEVTDETVTPGESVQILKLEKDGSNWMFNTEGSSYLSCTSTSNDSKLTTVASPSDNNHKATISIANDGKATVTFQSSQTRKILKFNPNTANSNPLFNCYASGQNDIYIYIEQAPESATAPKKAVITPNGGELIGDGAGQNNTVTITSVNATEIRWTKDGVAQTALTATAGVANLAITEDCTIEAWGYNSATSEEGGHTSATFTVVYAPTAAAQPTFSMNGGSNITYRTDVTINGVAGFTLEVSTDGENYETVTSPYVYTLTETVTLYARSRNAAGVTEAVSYTFNVAEPEGKVYHLMTDDEDFEDGMEFLIVSKAGTKVMGKDKGAFAEAVPVTVTNGEIKLIPGESPEIDIYPLKLVAIENNNNWAIQLVATGNDAGKYISNNTNFEYSDSPVAFGLSFLNANPNNTDPTSEIAVQFAGDNTTYRLRFNPSDARFRPYVQTNTNMEDVNFYVLGEKSTTKPKQAAFNKSGQLFGDGDLKNNNTVTVTSERATHIKYTVDGGETQTIVATDGVATLPEITADCTIEAWGYNQTTDEEGRSATANFTVVYLPTAAPTYSVSNDNNVDYKSKVVLTAPEGCTIQYSEDGSNWTEVESPFTYTFTHSVTLYSRSVNAAGYKETSVAYTMNEPAKSVYTLVTSDDELEEGQMYLVVAAKEPGKTYAMPYASNATAQEAKGYAVTIDEGNTITLIDVDTDVAVFEMTKGAGNEGYALKYADGRYMVLTNSNNTNGITSGESNNADAKLSISIDNSNAQATIEGVSSTRKIRFNTAGEAFRVYTNNAYGTVPVYLFALSNENKVLKPTLTVTGDKDLEGNYINAVTLVSEPVTEGSTVMYSSSLEPSVWAPVPQNWSLNAPQTITVKAVKKGMDESFTRTVTLSFRPATVDFVSSSDAQTGIMTITMSSETYGATIMYREGESGTWIEYDPSNPPTFEGDVVGLQAKAVYEPYAPLSESKIMTFGQRGDMVFELVTSADQLREGDEIVFVNYIPHSNQRTSKPEGAKDEPTSEPSYYAMTSDVYSNKHHRARRVEVIPNSEEEGRRQIIIPGGEDFAIFTLQKWTNDPNEPRPWMLQIDIEGESKYCASSVAEGSTAAAKMDFIGLPEQEKRHFVQTLLRIGTRNDYSEYTGFYWNNGLPGYNSTEESKSDLDDCATIVVGGEGKKASVARFNPAGNDVHFNFYGFDEDNDKPNATTWPVQIYRSTRQVLRPSITVYPKEVSYADGTYTEEWSDQSLAPEALPFYNPVKIVVTENPRTKAGATLNYYWAKNETLLPVSEEYTAIEGSEVKGADMTVYVDGFDLFYIDVDNYEHRFANYFLGQNPENRVMTNQTDYMSSTLFSISMLDGQSSPNTHRNVVFETTEPVLEKVDGGVQVHRPDVFTKGAVLYYTTDGTQPTVTYDANGNIIDHTGEEVDPEAVISFDNGVLTVGAFKYGYKPNFAKYSNLTVYPYVQPVQLLQLNTQAVKDIIEASTVSDEEKAALGYTAALEAIANQADQEVMTDTYLTYRTGAADKYYMLAYTVDGNDDIETITIVDVDDNAAKTVIKNPHLFKWTTDYYVFGMRLDEFESKVPFYKNDEEDRPVMLVTDGEDEVRVKPTVLRLNENLGEDQDEENNITYYGAVFRRHGSLGQTYFRTNFSYKAKVNAEDEWQEFTDLRSYTRVVPNVPKPFDLSVRYVAERDDAFFMDPDWVEIEEAVLDEDNNVVTPAKRGFKFSSKGTATSEGRSLVGTSIPDLEVENDLYFREEDFALRKFNCVFSFHRPNVSDEILDNYDIVYDIQVLTGADRPDPRHNYVDPLKSDEIDYAASNMDDHDAVNRYEFTVNNVYPLSTINPELVIRNVTYIPNDAESDLSQLIANYSGETVAKGETPLADFTQNIVAENLTSASEPDVKFEMAWFPQENGKYGWELLQHKELDNSGNLIHYDEDNANNNVELEAPFMYHLEAYYPGNDVQETGVDHYFSHPYLIGHDKKACLLDREENENFVDPFYKIVVGQDYSANEVNGKLLVNSPRIYLTPIYLFYRNPQPTVTNEDALYLYTEYLENGGKAPKRAPQRAEASAQALSRDDIVIVRGTAYGTDEITNPDDNVMTDVDKLAQDGIRQVGNNLVLPQGARLYDMNGIQLRPEGLAHGVYLVRLADGRTVKVAVK